MHIYFNRIFNGSGWVLGCLRATHFSGTYFIATRERNRMKTCALLIAPDSNAFNAETDTDCNQDVLWLPSGKTSPKKHHLRLKNLLKHSTAYGVRTESMLAIFFWADASSGTDVIIVCFHLHSCLFIAEAFQNTQRLYIWECQLLAINYEFDWMFYCV